MQAAAITVGTSAVQVPVSGTPSLGVRLLARNANSGDVYLGTTSGVTTSTGVLIPKGDPGVVAQYTVPADHFVAGKSVYLIASGASQVVDWSAQ